MKEFKDRIAVVTGAASGIGRAIAERCGGEGMKVVLAGINKSNLLEVEKELRASGASAISVQTDVSQRGDMEALAQRTIQEFGAVHLLVNNAGVGAGSSPWQTTWQDWEWVLNVNLWGVINGVKVFTPIMLKQNTEGYIINNASIAGLITFHPNTPYMVSKHAVVALSENLHHWLKRYDSQVKVSVLCPGSVSSRIMDSRRNRPVEFQDEPLEMDAVERRAFRELIKYMRIKMPAEKVADMVFQAMQEEKFYIITHPDLKPAIQDRMEDLLDESTPREPLLP
jgi:NAD(P)-dependent dehydrogenase (short-subunit alcohol dehydrogenase family)